MVGLTDLGIGNFSGQAVAQTVLILKVVGSLVVVGAIIMGGLWIRSWKDEIIIFSKGSKMVMRDRGRMIRRKDGTIGYKFFKTMMGKSLTIPPPDDKLALISPKGKRIFYCIKVGVNQYHFLKMPNKYEGEVKIEVIPHDMVNWFIETDKMNRRKFQSVPDWKQWMLPAAFAVFVVMVCITLIYLFKELPTNIAVTVVQQGSQNIPGFT